MRLAASLAFVGCTVQDQDTTDTAPSGAAQIETAFSPDGGSEALVVKVIHSAKQTIRLSAYSFTSPAVVRALIDAKRRGVEVAVVADYKNNVTKDRSGKLRRQTRDGT